MVRLTKIFSILFITSDVFACFPHQNLLTCWDMQEGGRTIVRDNSSKGLTGILTGGPGWVKAPLPFGTMDTNAASTNTFVQAGDWMVTFPGTVGVDVESQTTAIFDFSGPKPYEICITFQLKQRGAGTIRSLVAFNDNATGIGWNIQIDNNDNVLMCHDGVVNKNFGAIIPDLNPHRLTIGRDASTSNMRAYIDGKFMGSFANVADMATGNTVLNVGNAAVTGANAWDGKAGRLAIYSFNFTNDQMDAFARDEYNYWQGLDYGGEVGGEYRP